MMTNFADLGTNLPTSFIHCNRLVDNLPKEGRFLLCLVFMSYHIAFEGSRGGGGGLVHHLLELEFLRATWVVIRVLPSLAEYAEKGVTLDQLHAMLKKS